MSKTYEVPAELREDVGKGASRRLRRQKKVPAIVYGEGRAPANLTLEHDYIAHAVEQEAFHASILELKVGDGRKQKVVLRDLQRHPYKPTILHVDFQRVSEKHELRIEVPLHFLNEEISPAGKQGGVVIQYLATEVEISALPKDLPEYIEVDISGMQLDDMLHLSDIKVPAGVELVDLTHGEEYDQPIVSVHIIKQAPIEEEEPAEEESAEVPTVSDEEAEEAGEGEGEGEDEKKED